MRLARQTLPVFAPWASCEEVTKSGLGAFEQQALVQSPGRAAGDAPPLGGSIARIERWVEKVRKA